MRHGAPRRPEGPGRKAIGFSVALHAALLNGITSHVLDYDDTHLKTIIHPAGPVASALLALAEVRPLSGRDLLTALIVGVEVECRIGNSVYPDHYDRGWHITGTAGVFGAAAAVGHAIGLDAQKMRWALGLAATQSAGLREMFGTMTKSFHPGRAARLVRRYGLNVVACNVERQRLPFADGTFAHVIFNEVLEHLRVDPLLALSEANRVLAPGGSLLLTTPNLYFIKTVMKFLLGRGFNDPVQEFGKLRSVGHMGHVREYARGEVRRFVEASGFTIRSHKLTQYNYPRNLFGAVSLPLLSLMPFLQGTQILIATKTAAGPNLLPLTRS